MTEGTVYAVASGKGGVGKTTTAVNLGAGFAHAGRSVVVVDMDLGMANLRDFVEATPGGTTLHEVLAGEATLDDALSHVSPGLDVILGSEDLSIFGRADPRGLRTLLADLRTRYDVVILDSGGGLSHDTALPLGLADAIVLVSTVEQPAVKNTAKTLELAEKLDGTLSGIVLTRVGGGKSEVDPTEIASRLDLSLLGSVPEDSTVKASAEAGEPLLQFDRDSPASQAYLEIAYELLGENLPVDFGEGRGTGDVAAAETAGTDASSDDDEGDGADQAPEMESPEEGVAVEEAEGDTTAAEAVDDATDDETADRAVDESEDADTDENAPLAEELDGEEEPAESRSLLSKLTGGLFG